MLISSLACSADNIIRVSSIKIIAQQISFINIAFILIISTENCGIVFWKAYADLFRRWNLNFKKKKKKLISIRFTLHSQTKWPIFKNSSIRIPFFQRVQTFFILSPKRGIKDPFNSLSSNSTVISSFNSCVLTCFLIHKSRVSKWPQMIARSQIANSP